LKGTWIYKALVPHLPTVVAPSAQLVPTPYAVD